MQRSIFSDEFKRVFNPLVGEQLLKSLNLPFNSFHGFINDHRPAPATDTSNQELPISMLFGFEFLRHIHRAQESFNIDKIYWTGKFILKESLQDVSTLFNQWYRKVLTRKYMDHYNQPEVRKRVLKELNRNIIDEGDSFVFSKCFQKEYKHFTKDSEPSNILNWRLSEVVEYRSDLLNMHVANLFEFAKLEDPFDYSELYVDKTGSYLWLNLQLWGGICKHLGNYQRFPINVAGQYPYMEKTNRRLTKAMLPFGQWNILSFFKESSLLYCDDDKLEG